MNPLYTPGSYNLLIRKLAKENGISFLDIDPDSLAEMDIVKMMKDRGIDPSNKYEEKRHV